MPKKRSRKNHKRKLVLILFIILIVLIPPSAWFFSYGLVRKPLVDYTFGRASDVRLSYTLSAMTQYRPGTIDIINVLIRNRGLTDISVIVTVHAENALLSASYEGPYNEMASNLIVSLANGEYRYVTFYLTLKAQVSSFTIWCDVTKIVDYSTVSSSVATTFGEIKPTSPILLKYKQDSSNPDTYQLIQL
jgi:hypothetical protein